MQTQVEKDSKAMKYKGSFKVIGEILGLMRNKTAPISLQHGVERDPYRLNGNGMEHGIFSGFSSLLFTFLSVF